MIIYLDLIFFINFFYDLFLLLTVAIVLRRNSKFYRHLISAFIGALSVFILLIDINSFLLLLLKVIVSIGMSLISFGFINLRYLINNIIYLYMCSIILAGFMYFLNIKFSYENIGMLFIHKGFSINYILILILSPIILIGYAKSSKKLKQTYNNFYNIKIVFDNYIIKCVALYDNGNVLKDPVTKKAVIIVNSNLLNKVYNIRNPIYVPYDTISGSGIMKCFKPSYIIINDKKIYNYLIGESTYKFKDGVSCVLNNKLMEENYV